MNTDVRFRALELLLRAGHSLNNIEPLRAAMDQVEELVCGPRAQPDIGDPPSPGAEDAADGAKTQGNPETPAPGPEKTGRKK